VHHTAIDGDTSLASDSHAVQAQPDAFLYGSQKAFVVDTSLGQAGESPDGENRASINKRAVHVSDFEISGDPSIPGGNRASTNFEVFDLQELSLFGFEALPGAIRELDDFVGPLPFPVLVPTPELGQGEDQQNQNALQHYHTLSPER
jgi:hypothetical protein